ncbi:hypothetical protein [Hydrogenothermus marinus]|uniref:Uncharacterized protein n=1 Tax=Hydrogenothermus marinus TaxID=133270 RepID=A0A3M0BSJ9_9AQUI|nr:hypothetical protein [Hydrogenothermus marinus]RMA97818.1 hypothetical protein CLV39_0447 [Hydrogenothermus marinus]
MDSFEIEKPLEVEPISDRRRSHRTWLLFKKKKKNKIKNLKKDLKEKKKNRLIDIYV